MAQPTNEEIQQAYGEYYSKLEIYIIATGELLLTDENTWALDCIEFGENNKGWLLPKALSKFKQIDLWTSLSPEHTPPQDGYYFARLRKAPTKVELVHLKPTSHQTRGVFSTKYSHYAPANVPPIQD